MESIIKLIYPTLEGETISNINVEDEKILKIVYEILEPNKDRGMVTIVFRHELSNYVDEDDDDVIIDFEYELIKSGWIHQDRKSRLLFPSQKLIIKFDF